MMRNGDCQNSEKCCLRVNQHRLENEKLLRKKWLFFVPKKIDRSKVRLFDTLCFWILNGFIETESIEKSTKKNRSFEGPIIRHAALLDFEWIH
ncbi:MAG: hypothetical protein ACJAUD_000564 [Crocinitomicaceae bacterium]|jgi:hypothetical protein